MRRNRGFSPLAGLMGGLAVAVLAATVTAASDQPSAEDSLFRLRAGNARFVKAPGENTGPDAERRAAVASDTHQPFAAVLSCADARVPPELIFNAGLGGLYVVRSAGPVTDTAVLASLEFALTRLHTPLLVVMGHESCDTVQAALDTSAAQHSGTHLEGLIKRLGPSVSRVSALPAAARMRAAILENVEEQINEVLTESATIRRLAEEGQVGLVGAYYELGSGVVHFTERVRVSPSPAGAPASAPAARRH